MCQILHNFLNACQIIREKEVVNNVKVPQRGEVLSQEPELAVEVTGALFMGISSGETGREPTE